jgi:hypothetical protein
LVSLDLRSQSLQRLAPGRSLRKRRGKPFESARLREEIESIGWKKVPRWDDGDSVLGEWKPSGLFAGLQRRLN